MCYLKDMFPPKRTKDATTFLNGMLSSLIRAGLEAHVEIQLNPDPLDAGSFMVRVPLRVPIPKNGWAPMRTYMRQYSKLSGWHLERARQTRGFLDLTILSS
jgi:hypothetical protein